MTAADHAKGLGRVKGRGAGNKRDGLLAGVDKITVISKSASNLTKLMIKNAYASTSSSVGCGPMPKRPFSLCSHTVLSLGTKHAAIVGMPTPRLT